MMHMAIRPPRCTARRAPVSGAAVTLAQLAVKLALALFLFAAALGRPLFLALVGDGEPPEAAPFFFPFFFFFLPTPSGEEPSAPTSSSSYSSSSVPRPA